ncbi:DUF4838 domain-containing protein [Trinickia sp.]|uniref:DUF4838 domain-containing protein n=1 Tax=Trinickia sp. TaxID=2571163 RepID=UPI0039C8E683
MATWLGPSPAFSADNSVSSAAASTPHSAPPPSPQLTLADHGVARYRIYVGAKADAMTRQAADELADYLLRMTGAEFRPIANDDEALRLQERPRIVIGRDNQLALALCPSARFDTLPRDGFIICTARGQIVIAGSSSRGTMYGVNWFMDRVLGVKWLAPDATYVPSRPVLRIDAINAREVPHFAYREVLSSEGQDKVFRAHNLLNGESHGPSFLASPPALDDWDHSWLAKAGEATFWDLLPRDEYLDRHPDWYAGGQLAMMNADVRRIIAANIVKRLKALPDYRNVWFGVRSMDWGWDMDAASRAFADRHGGRASAPLLDMMSDVAQQVRAKMPGAKLAFDAYHWGFAAPEGMTVPDYLLVNPMTIQVDYSTALNEGRNLALGEEIARWNAIAKHVLVWDHITNFGGYLQPTPNIYPIGASIRFLASLPHVMGYFAEGSWETPGAEFASLRVWLIARLLWNPAEDPHELVAQYCRDYFGPAAPHILAYIDLMHAALGASGDVMSEKTPVTMRMYSTSFVVRADRLFDLAERSVSDDPTLLARVRLARLPLDFVILVRRNEFEADAARVAPGWQLAYEKRLTRLKGTIREQHVTLYRQGGDIDALNALLAIHRTSAVRPLRAAALSDLDWHEYQDLGLNLYGSARIVADSAASDGAAVRMDGNSSVWAVQFKFDQLPHDGTWDLFVSLRVDGERRSGDGAFVRVGAYPPMTLFNQVPASELTEPNYREIPVPGGPFAFQFDHEKGVYVQPIGLNSTDVVFVDRIIAIRHRQGQGHGKGP